MNSMKSLRILGLAVVMACGLAGCDILDVNNPNNLVEEDLDNPAAAGAIVNGSLATITRAVGRMAAPYSTASDELTWIGSRDAWGSLDAGDLTDPNNEFTDAAFPFLGEARWMADRAIEQVRAFVEDDPQNGDLQGELARALLLGGLIYTTIGEIQDDFAFSNQRESAAPVGPANMDQTFQTAMGYLDEALPMAQARGLDELAIQILALRARTQHSLAIWGMLNPPGSTPSNPLVNNAGAVADAAEVINRVGVANPWSWELEFSANTVTSDVAFQVNERGELNFGPEYAALDPTDRTDITGYTLIDPVEGGLDPRIQLLVEDYVTRSEYAPITALSAAEMHLIRAEAALASGSEGDFATHLNRSRALGGMDAWSPDSGVPAMDMLIHERRVNLFMGLRRLADMYRFGEQAPSWLPGSTAATTPGTMLPITITEIRANSFCSEASQSCEGG